jgi:hypothetical protein
MSPQGLQRWLTLTALSRTAQEDERAADELLSRLPLDERAAPGGGGDELISHIERYVDGVTNFAELQTVLQQPSSCRDAGFALSTLLQRCRGLVAAQRGQMAAWLECVERWFDVAALLSRGHGEELVAALLLGATAAQQCQLDDSHCILMISALARLYSFPGVSVLRRLASLLTALRTRGGAVGDVAVQLLDELRRREGESPSSGARAAGRTPARALDVSTHAAVCQSCFLYGLDAVQSKLLESKVWNALLFDTAPPLAPAPAVAHRAPQPVLWGVAAVEPALQVPSSAAQLCQLFAQTPDEDQVMLQRRLAPRFAEEHARSVLLFMCSPESLDYVIAMRLVRMACHKCPAAELQMAAVNLSQFLVARLQAADLDGDDRQRFLVSRCCALRLCISLAEKLPSEVLKSVLDMALHPRIAAAPDAFEQIVESLVLLSASLSVAQWTAVCQDVDTSVVDPVCLARLQHLLGTEFRQPSGRDKVADDAIFDGVFGARAPQLLKKMRRWALLEGRGVGLLPGWDPAAFVSGWEVVNLCPGLEIYNEVFAPEDDIEDSSVDDDVDVEDGQGGESALKRPKV